MKKTIFFLFTLFLSITVIAQGELANNDLYLTFEWMEVNDKYRGDYLDVEEFWEGIHQQRANAGEILGWDLWTVLPGGSDQGSQFLVVTLYSSLGGMLNAGNSKIRKHAEAAYPDKNAMAIQKMMEMTPKTRDIAHRVFLKQIDATDDDFDMPVGMVATLDAMMATDDRYEKMESKIFKPMHQKQVDNGKKASWGLLKVLLPTGSGQYASHGTVNMFKDMDQLATAWENWGGMGDDMARNLAIREGLNSREHKGTVILRLIKKVRAPQN